MIIWEKTCKARLKDNLIRIETNINEIYKANVSRIFSRVNKFRLIELESNQLPYLKREEETRRLKSRALWLNKGDLNTRFFHQYANHQKIINSIWDLEDNVGNCISG